MLEIYRVMIMESALCISVEGVGRFPKGQDQGLDRGSGRRREGKVRSAERSRMPAISRRGARAFVTVSYQLPSRQREQRSRLVCPDSAAETLVCLQSSGVRSSCSLLVSVVSASLAYRSTESQPVCSLFSSTKCLPRLYLDDAAG
jgi:hypothetical protein